MNESPYGPVKTLPEMYDELDRQLTARCNEVLELRGSLSAAQAISDLLQAEVDQLRHQLLLANDAAEKPSPQQVLELEIQELQQQVVELQNKLALWESGAVSNISRMMIKTADDLVVENDQLKAEAAKKREPLGKKAIRRLAIDWSIEGNWGGCLRFNIEDVEGFAREIERAHGIGELK